MTTTARVPRQPLSPTPTRRWWAYVRERQLRCPCGHHIPHTFAVTEAGFIQCRHKQHPTDARLHDRRGSEGYAGARVVECGLWVFLFPVRGGKVITVQVTPDECEPMRDLGTPAAMLDYLGIWGEP